MNGSPDDERIDELRRKRMEQLQAEQQQQQQAGDAEATEQAQRQAELQQQAVLRQYLTDGARKRLNSVKMSKPEFAEQVERQLVALAQSGRIQGKIDEDKMQALLRELTPDRKKFDIKRR